MERDDWEMIIREAAPEDTEEILALTKVIGEETDNLTFGREGIPISADAEKVFLADTAMSDRSVFFERRI